MKQKELTGVVRCIKIEPGKDPSVVLVNPTLEAFQAEIEGYLEVIRCPWDPNLVLIVDEEGKIKESPANRYLRTTAGLTAIVGTILICGDADGNFCSMSMDQIRAAEVYLPRYMPRIGGMRDD